MNGQVVRAAVVVDTMAPYALINSRRRPGEGNPFEELIADRRVVVSFATVTELRCGSINGKWGELRRRSLERNLRTFRAEQPDSSCPRPVAHSASCARLADLLRFVAEVCPVGRRTAPLPQVTATD